MLKPEANAGDEAGVGHGRELPVGRWTTDYKEQVLAPMLAARALRGVEERHTESAVDFVLSMPRAALRELEDAEGGLQRALSLQSTIGTSNMHAFDPSSRIRRYDGPGGVLRDFFPVRLELYRRRREWLKARYTASSRRLSNRARFVGEVASGDFALFGADRAPRPHALLEALCQQYIRDALHAVSASQVWEL